MSRLSKKQPSIHFIGIGGIGMSGIAQVLLQSGHKVTGSDISYSETCKRLEKLGAKIYTGHHEDHVKDATFIVYSTAISSNNPEFVQAMKLNIPIIRRAEMLAELMRLKKGVAIAGTHGKTTTTSFLATILKESGTDITYIIGGIVENLEGHARVGQGDYLVAEACESDGSFLFLSPVYSLITNIDNDHLNFYAGRDELEDSFYQFANKIPFYGTCALNTDDPCIKKFTSKMKRPFVTFGLKKTEDRVPDYFAYDIKLHHSYTEFKLQIAGLEKEWDIQINVPGLYNVYNALGAISIADQIGVPIEDIKKSITKFKGVARRFQILLDSPSLEIIDDYAHHPTEIKSVLETVKKTRKGKIISIFQPHRYSRTKDLWSDFLHCFNNSDEVYMTPIYPASESPISGIESDRLIRDINHLHPHSARLLSSFEELDLLVKKLMEDQKEKNILITMGAGTIGKEIRNILRSIL